MSAELQKKIYDLSKRQYKYRAYASYALTALSAEESERSCDLMERLCIEVFEKFDVFLYLPHLFSSPNAHKTMVPEHVNMLDRIRIAQSDFVVLCADRPSFGVGQEYEIAQAMGLPIVVFHEQGKSVSRMLIGGVATHVKDPYAGTRPSLGVVAYTDEQNLKDQLEERVKLIRDDLRPRTNRPARFGRMLNTAMTRARKDVRTLADETGLPDAYVRFLLTTEENIDAMFDRYENLERLGNVNLDRYTNVAAGPLLRLASALKISTSDLLGVSSDEALKRLNQQALEEEVLWPLIAERNPNVIRLRDRIRANPSMQAEAAKGLSKEKVPALIEQARELLIDEKDPVVK
jgi:hypothetical protein